MLDEPGMDIGWTEVGDGMAGAPVPKAFIDGRAAAGVNALAMAISVAAGAVPDVLYTCAALIPGGTGARRISGIVTIGTGI